MSSPHGDVLYGATVPPKLYAASFRALLMLGIGAATVAALRKQKMKVYAIDCRTDRLPSLAEETGCTPLVLDLRDTEALYATLGPLRPDAIVNNVGLGRGMPSLLDAPADDIDTTVETNVSAIYHVIKATVPGMVERRCGHIVNIDSVAGLYPIASAVYGGSKGAVHLLSQNLRLELRGSGVRVSEICPGRVATEFFNVAIDNPDTRAAVNDSGIALLTADDIAAAVHYAVNAPWRVNVSLIELQPNEQAFGGFSLNPVANSDK